ncbi:MAG: PorP/SprF family type IX secretion system membrane protein [Bacteroidia bacterium]|nr:PorP/SprF family type IX secretion system membrane protein [Bacteroidia bacterium]
MKHQIVLSIIAFTGTSLLAQDPHFTQFYANPLYMNPATAGNGFVKEAPAGRLTTVYRNQGPGLPNHTKTFSLGWDQQFDKLHGGVGAQFITESTSNGFIRNSGLLVNYAGRFNVGKKTQLSLGLQGGAMKKTLDFDKLIIGESYDKTIDTNLLNPTMKPKSSITYPNINMGTLINGEHYFFGISVFNLTKPNISFYHNPNVVLPRRVAIHGGYSFSLSNNLFIIPQVQYQKQENETEIMLGVNANQNNLIYGLWYRQTFGQYRNFDAFAGTIGYNFKGFRLIYSYDVAISDGRSAIPSSHELSLRYCWKTKQNGPKFCNALN